MDHNFIFIHGWGMGKGIWDRISEHFPAEHSTFLDLGFIGSEQQLDVSSERPAIYITHSLGTAYALKQHAPDIDALIAINGFACFEDFVDMRVLRAMQKQLDRNPSAQMKAFWTNCGLDESLQTYLDACLNTDRDRLHRGLKWLIQWDMYQNLQLLEAPVISLGGAKDKILPIDQMNMQWSGFDVRIHENGDHVLPLSQPEWCVENIKGFISELELER